MASGKRRRRRPRRRVKCGICSPFRLSGNGKDGVRAKEYAAAIAAAREVREYA